MALTPTWHGVWIPGEEGLVSQEMGAALRQVARPVFCIEKAGERHVVQTGAVRLNGHKGPDAAQWLLRAHALPLLPENLGDPDFRRFFGLTCAYIVGAMANGITSVDMVAAAGNAGMIGFFGAGGLTLPEIESAVHALRERLGERPCGFNLIHSPFEPDHEQATVDLYLREGVRLVSASAYLGLTAPLVQYRVSGIHRAPGGGIVCPNRIIGKVSRVEVAEKLLSPPPGKWLRVLLERGRITREEAELAAQVPMVDALTAEADSGGHTDNRPAVTLLPTMIALRDRMMERFGYARPVWVGLAGGIATPESAAAAFAMGAAYVLTGSVNQACREAGTSDAVRAMLAEARQADVTMAPAADMFEMGVRVQVLKRGTMFPQKAARLYDLYSRFDRYEAIPEAQRRQLEKDYFRCGFDEAWASTRRFFAERDPRQNERAETDLRHRMALVFRSYLGLSPYWAKQGDASRRIDYQIWCGPAMGAFNEWVRGSFLDPPENRDTVTVAMNLLVGAAVVTRASWLRCQGIDLPARAAAYRPLPLGEIQKLTADTFEAGQAA